MKNKKIIGIFFLCLIACLFCSATVYAESYVENEYLEELFAQDTVDEAIEVEVPVDQTEIALDEALGQAQSGVSTMAAGKLVSIWMGPHNYEYLHTASVVKTGGVVIPVAVRYYITLRYEIGYRNTTDHQNGDIRIYDFNASVMYDANLYNPVEVTSYYGEFANCFYKDTNGTETYVYRYQTIKGEYIIPGGKYIDGRIGTFDASVGMKVGSSLHTTFNTVFTSNSAIPKVRSVGTTLNFV